MILSSWNSIILSEKYLASSSSWVTNRTDKSLSLNPNSCTFFDILIPFATAKATRIVEKLPGPLLIRIEKSGDKILEVPAIVNEIRPSVSVIYKRIPRTIYSLIKLRIQLFKESLNTNNL